MSAKPKDEPATVDVLIFLNPKDLVGRSCRKRKGSVYTAAGELCLNIWLALPSLEGLRIGTLTYTQSASASYLWHKREPIDAVVERYHRLLAGSR